MYTVVDFLIRGHVFQPQHLLHWVGNHHWHVFAEVVMDPGVAIQGKVTGVIIPPPEIRAVVDKTAQFVGKNGKTFEHRILESAEGKTAKFNFMRSMDPYHAYYEMKIR